MVWYTEWCGIYDHVTTLFEDRDGRIWIGTARQLYCFDGEKLHMFSSVDGVGEYFQGIYQTRDGALWFVTEGDGASRYDGEIFTRFSIPDGERKVLSMHEDRDGNLWFGTPAGVYRYDGKSFSTIEALAGQLIVSIIQDRAGHLWFASRGGGVSHYDGQVCQVLTRMDGLPDNVVHHIFEDNQGFPWFSTSRGFVLYRPSAPVPPRVQIQAVVADRRYEHDSKVTVSTTADLIAFEFHGLSMKTRPEGMVYRHRLRGYEEDWQTTRERRVEYEDLPAGTYTFEVQAVDRDLVYSEQSATLALTIQLPYERIGLWGALIIA